MLSQWALERHFTRFVVFSLALARQFRRAVISETRWGVSPHWGDWQSLPRYCEDRSWRRVDQWRCPRWVRRAELHQGGGRRMRKTCRRCVRLEPRCRRQTARPQGWQHRWGAWSSCASRSSSVSWWFHGRQQGGLRGTPSSLLGQYLHVERKNNMWIRGNRGKWRDCLPGKVQ